jgi:hypothetical protein
MLDLILLIFLAIKMGNLALVKGLPSGKWRMNLVIAWVIAEMIGLAIGLLIFGKENLVSCSIIGLGCALTAYFLMHNYLHKMPDKMDEDKNNIEI